MTRTFLLLAVLSIAGIVLTMTSITCSGAGYYSNSDYWPYPKTPYLQQSAWYNEINFFLNDYGETYYPTTEQYSYSLPTIFSYGAYANMSVPIFLTPYYPSIANSRN